MTYLFKLVRRLAISRDSTMLSLLALLAACAGDATAPEGTAGPADINPASIRVLPPVATLALGASRTFNGTAYLRDSSVVPLRLVWSATGGTMDPDGKFTADSISGVYHVIAANTTGTVADTAEVTVVPPPTPVDTSPPVAGSGVPYGPVRPPSALDASFAAFSLGTGAGAVVSTIAKARAAHLAIVLAFPCGPHSSANLGKCLSLVNGVPTFDMAKYRAAMAPYNTPEIKAAIAAGQADGTLMGSNVMDEPQVCGGGDNTWGPCGTMTKARVDSLCAMHKALGLRAIVGQDDPAALDPKKNYAVCDAMVANYGYRHGPLLAWRDSALAFAARSHISVQFHYNAINGGTQDRDGTWDCAAQGGVKGNRPPNCTPTAAQIKEIATTLGPLTCGAMLFWWWDAARNNIPALKQAHVDAAAALKKLPAPKACVRTD